MKRLIILAIFFICGSLWLTNHQEKIEGNRPAYFLTDHDRRMIQADPDYFIQLKKKATGIDVNRWYDNLAPNKAYGAITKTVTQIDEWASTADQAIREGAVNDVSAAYDAVLHIDMALTTGATAHSGTKIDIQISSATSGDEDWSTYAEFLGPQGTPNTEAVTGTEAIGATVIECASTTGLYDDAEARWIFFLNGTVANSELGYQVSFVSNTSVTVQDGITAAQTSSTMSDIAATYTVRLPFSANRVRVIYDNSFDAAASAIHTRTRISKVTAI